MKVVLLITPVVFTASSGRVIRGHSGC